MNAAAALASLPRRGPFPLLALVLCLAFAVVGVAVLDDYGIGADELVHRRVAEANLDYILGDSQALPSDHNRFYGVAFELPLLLIERALGLRDSRDIYLMRHLAVHLLFLLGAFFCGLLAWRMFGSRALAALALLLFLLHPRLYAHSFFNSKDPVFAALFMIALFLIHRAFRKGSLSAFALCGFGVGLAIDLRPFGLLLLPAVLAMQGLDFWQAAGKSERRRILAAGGAFAVATLATMYAVHPYYWLNPLRFLDGIATLSQHPNLMHNFFQGEFIRSDEVPPHFIPTWFAITAPPLTLLLGGIGAMAVCWQGVLRPGGILRNGELRFRLLLVGCATLPVAAAIALQSNLYGGWRHFYFLWAPFSLLAAAGLLALGRGGDALPRRFLAWGAAGAGLVCVAVEMAWLHPHQQIYFNLLVDRHATGGLAQRYDMDYWDMSYRRALEQLRAHRPDAMLHVFTPSNSLAKHRRILPALDRRHIVLSPAQQADYQIGNSLSLMMRWTPSSPAVVAPRAYGSAYLVVVAPRLVWGGGLSPGAEAYRAAHRSLVAAGKPAARANFDVYLKDGALHYVKEDCGPADAKARFFLHIFPADAKDLPLHRRKYWFENLDFSFAWRGGYFDGKCMTQEPLPGYPVARIRTGQFVRGEGQLWKAEVPLP